MNIPTYPDATVKIRKGLPHVAAKWRQGKPLTIAFHGGSITWGGNATDIDRFSYRARTVEGLRQMAECPALTAINAGVGGTNSELGAYRMAEDVLHARPDLMFVEFAVNDGGADEQIVTGALESIILQLLEARPDADICFIYALSKNELDKGGYSNIMKVHERVTEHYGIPSIRMGDAFLNAIRSGSIPWESGFVDAVHPNDEGHRWYAQAILDAWPALCGTKLKASRKSILPRLDNDAWHSARMIRADQGKVTAGAWKWRDQNKGVGWDALCGQMETDHPGSTIEFDLDGSHFGIYLRYGDDLGNMEYRLDGGEWITWVPSTEGYWDCPRIGPKMLFPNVTPGPHRLAIRAKGKHKPESKGGFCRLSFVLVR
ncbi:MAG: SGNH/GDSL hydrolase family protein [Phycisphaeraceae bacterium]|nr:SGNH/GDSL hydrolase family protein [Phycisphaeraceae bacterium]